MKWSNGRIPTILLVGAGHFGRHHMAVLREFHEKGFIHFAGVFVKHKNSVKRLRDSKIPVFTSLSSIMLKQVDAVDITTPPHTHFSLAKQCLPFTHVFLEKPISLSSREGLLLDREARRQKKILFIGHIYRFNAAVQRLKKLIQESKTKPWSVEAVFVDTPGSLPDDCGVLLSDLHGFDILDYLFERPPISLYCTGTSRRSKRGHEDDAVTVLDYGKILRAVVTLSWNGLPKTRELRVYFSDKTIKVDLPTQIIRIRTGSRERVVNCFKEMPLHQELQTFFHVISGKRKAYPDAIIGTRIVDIAHAAKRSLQAGKVVGYDR